LPGGGTNDPASAANHFIAGRGALTLTTMRYGWAMLTLIAWGLWFGGMIALFVFVSALFMTDRQTAMIAAPRMFAVFERYQFVVAGIALLSAALWRFAAPGRTSISVIFLFFVVAAVGLMVSAVKIRPPLERLRLQGQSTSGEFQRLHKLSERLYMCEAIALLMAGIILPAALTLDRLVSSPPKTAPEAAGPTAPPDGPADRVA
jgi:hypothetical protein